MPNNTTTDALQIMHRRYVAGNPEMLAMLEAEKLQLEIAQHVYDLRNGIGHTQEEFAALVCVEPTVIDELEEADYAGDALAVLARIEKTFCKHFKSHIVPAKSVYPNALLGTTITGLKLSLFRYHNGRTSLSNGTKPPEVLSTRDARLYLLNELRPWQQALELNRQELKMFTTAGINEWCHISGKQRVNLSGAPDEYLYAVEKHRQLIDAIIYRLETGEGTVLKQWRQDMGDKEQARYTEQLAHALHEQTFAAFPDTEWLAQTLIAFGTEGT